MMEPGSGLAIVATGRSTVGTTASGSAAARSAPATNRNVAEPEPAGNGAAIGGLKVTTESAWFAARPSGTEDVYKIYAESFRGPEHLAQVQADAKAVVDAALGG